MGAPQRQRVAGVDPEALDRSAVVRPWRPAPGSTHPLVALVVAVVLGAPTPADEVVRLGLTISHGLPCASQLSVFSTCQPSAIPCSKMPNS